MGTPVTTSGDACSFKNEAEIVLRRLRAAFAAIVSALPESTAKASDLQRILKIDMKLSWKILRVLNAADPLTEGHNIPGPSNMKTFFKAARSRGVPAPLIQTAADAAGQFERFVITHAGDRAAFDSMISDLAGTDATVQMHLRHRRAAYRANRHIWGVQAKSQMRCLIAQPSEDPEIVSMAILQGYLGLSRLRSQSPLVVSGVRIRNDDNTIRPVRYEPLAGSRPASHGISLIPEFCSSPLPQFDTVEGESGFVHGQLVGNSVGNLSAVSCIHGHVIRNGCPRYRDATNHRLRQSTRIRIPCERLVQDLIVREDTFGPISPKAGLFADHLGITPMDERAGVDEDGILTGTVAYLGKGSSVLHTPHVPRYPEMVQYAFERLGWDGSRFNAYRCEVDYPAMGGIVRLWCELPERSER